MIWPHEGSDEVVEYTEEELDRMMREADQEMAAKRANKSGKSSDEAGLVKPARKLSPDDVG